MLKLFLRSFKADGYSGGVLFSLIKRAGPFLGLWLTLGVLVPRLAYGWEFYESGYCNRITKTCSTLGSDCSDTWVEKYELRTECEGNQFPYFDAMCWYYLDADASKGGYPDRRMPRYSRDRFTAGQGLNVGTDDYQGRSGKWYLRISGDNDESGGAEACQYSFEVVYGRVTNVQYVPIEKAAYGDAGGVFVTFSDREIPSGSVSPSSDIGTDFGDIPTSAPPIKLTYSLVNYGDKKNVLLSLADYIPDNDALMVGESRNYPVANGIGRSDFTVSSSTLTIPAGTYGAPGQSTFDITFKPGGEGLRQAVVNIDNEDGENEIRFLIQGGTELPLQLRGGDRYRAIGDMDDTPEEAEGTDFLSQKISDTPTTHTFTLLNKETRDITAIIELRDPTTGFSLSEQSVVVPTATDEGAGSAAFDITFDPATNGLHETFVDLSYDGERQLSFKISGEGESGGGGAASPLGLGLLGLLLAGLGYRRYRLSNQAA
ncbi:MAG: choice-of-anchor D domain-containing protein [Thiolinea sp.]